MLAAEVDTANYRVRLHVDRVRVRVTQAILALAAVDLIDDDQSGHADFEGDGRTSARHVRLDVRGLAILGVMVMFVAGISPSGGMGARLRISTYGVWGVDLFFVLSGFLITGILADSKGSSGYLRNFYMRRTLRIFPLYYLVLVVLFVVVPVLGLGWLDPELVELQRAQVWVWFYLTNYYLAFQETFSLPYVSHFWSLSVEEQFYLAWPLVILILSRRSAMRMCFILGLSALVIRVWYATTAPNLLASFLSTPCRLDALCVGAWFALSLRERTPLRSTRAVLCFAVSAAGILALSSWHVVHPATDSWVLPSRTTLLAVFLGLFIYLTVVKVLPPAVGTALRMTWLTWLGKYSYGLYVFHGMVAYAFERHSPGPFLMQMVGIHALAATLQIAVGAMLSIGIAVTSYELYESRFLALKRRF